MGKRSFVAGLGSSAFGAHLPAAHWNSRMAKCRVLKFAEIGAGDLSPRPARWTAHFAREAKIELQ
jgi:hypothetical protein